MDTLNLSLFRGMRDTQPQSVTLIEVVTMMRTDQSVRDLTEKHRYARSTGDEQGARHYKQMMTNFGVAARFEGGRQQKHIVALTGLSLVDIDHIAPEDMERVLALVQGDPHTLLAYVTLSGQGLRVLYRYAVSKTTDCTDYTDLSTDGISTPHSNNPSNPWLDNKEYRQVFLHGNEYYSKLTGLPTDPQCKNVGRVSAIAHDPDLYYNPDAVPFTIAPEEKKPVGRPKKVKSEELRVKSCKVKDVEAIVLGELERRGVRYEPGNHNKYISDACYEMNRLGVPEEDCTAWALRSFPDYAATDDVPAIVRSCYRHTDEHATRQPHRTGRGESKVASAHAIAQWLDGQHISTRYNVLTRKHEVQSQPEATFVELTDRILNTICCDINRALPCRVLKSDLIMVVESNRSPEYNPLLEYLDSLPQWDGTGDPIAGLASMVTTSNDAAELHCRFFKKWLVGLVACWLDPMVTNHVILAYIGRQGIYKSTFMRSLLPPVLADYFAVRNFTQMMNTDDRLLLTEKALIALEEIDTLTPTQVAQLNAIVTTTTISERAAYARYRESRCHIASFCATGNNPRFLTDVYGTRRWLPFLVTDIRSPYDHPIAHDEVYAQAYALYRQGFAYWFTSEEISELERHNREFEEVSHEEELILTYLRRPYGDDAGEFVTSTRIIEIVGQYIRTRLNARKVKRAMERLGFEQRKIRGQRGWNVVFLTGDDIKNNQRTDARESTPDE